MVLEVLEVLEVLAAADEDIRPPAGRDKRDPPAGLFPVSPAPMVLNCTAVGFVVDYLHMGIA